MRSATSSLLQLHDAGALAAICRHGCTAPSLASFWQKLKRIGLHFLPARQLCKCQYCYSRIQRCPSVRPFVCHTRALYQNERRRNRTLYFCRYQVHPKIQKGSLRASALHKIGIGTNKRFSTFKPPYLRNGARQDQGYAIINRKSTVHTRFLLGLKPLQGSRKRKRKT